MEIWLISASFIYILIQYQLFESVYNFVQIPSWDWIQKQSEINKKKKRFQHDSARYYLLSLLISLWVNSRAVECWSE